MTENYNQKKCAHYLADSSVSTLFGCNLAIISHHHVTRVIRVAVVTTPLFSP